MLITKEETEELSKLVIYPSWFNFSPNDEKLYYRDLSPVDKP